MQITSICHMAHFPVATMLARMEQTIRASPSNVKGRGRYTTSSTNPHPIQQTPGHDFNYLNRGSPLPYCAHYPCSSRATQSFLRKGAKWDIGNPSATNSPFSPGTKFPGYINNLKIRATATNSEMRRPLNDKVSNLGKENNCTNEATSASADSGTR